MVIILYSCIYTIAVYIMYPSRGCVLWVELFYFLCDEGMNESLIDSDSFRRIQH